MYIHHHILISYSGYRTGGLEDSQNSVTWHQSQRRARKLIVPSTHTSNNLDLGNAVRVSEDDTDLGGSSTLSGELGDLLDDLVGGGLQPSRSGSGVGERGGRNALALGVKSAHLVGLVVVILLLRMRSWRRSFLKFTEPERICVER